MLGKSTIQVFSQKMIRRILKYTSPVERDVRQLDEHPDYRTTSTNGYSAESTIVKIFCKLFLLLYIK